MGCYCNVGVPYDYNSNLYAAAVVKPRVPHIISLFDERTKNSIFLNVKAVGEMI